ncbi:MAG TPA: 8-amino-7-oxononanoate synthase, partial [Syntrophorhabdaceae bacterium]|nr:8-amino-7-oxononanoate synthase [Syntrophorhabdaceae bacterium]
MQKQLKKRLDDIRKKGNYRQLRYIKPVTSTQILYNGKAYLNLCSNSYLSLHVHPDILKAAKDVIDEYGAGTCSSRSVSGSIDIYGQLEKMIARYKGYRKGLIFSNGYMANIAIISTLTDSNDVIFSDELNHSSLIDATRLSRAKKVIYKHRDMNDLEKKLGRERSAGKRFVVTESVFSMDGDIAPLSDIFELRERYGFHMILDDAHGTGVFGQKGTGVEELFGLSGSMDVHMATFGKALGSFGAFVLSDEVVINFLINRARTFMYTTALPASSLASAMKALEMIEQDTTYKDRLWKNIDYMRMRLNTAGFDLKDSVGPIIPIVVGEDAKTLRMQESLMRKGLFLQGIRPPTVPEGTSRLRLTVVRGFTQEDMDYAIETIIHAGKKMEL